ncbi:Alpha beta hydrolase fold protein [Neofusicoccum parvum]|uniref:Alpha beta hydrolase fold protein n=1 Tax=Neofusicoccum parvum TaxID=310453 RepID=A0ACB5S3T6_9PEZI|nr:Alpha beta hydrolase fold protein [Neofusicoccum parvum]
MPPRPASQVRLTITEKIQLVFTIAIVLAQTCISALRAPFLSPEKRSRVSQRHVAYQLVHNLFSHTSSKVEQALSPDTDVIYRQWAKKTGVTPEKETIKDGSDAFWIGSKDAKTILLYFHGGGYNIPALPGHLDFLWNLVKDLNASADGGFAVLLLQYDVSPFEVYPRQLAQAAGLVNHVLETLKVAPENILIGGDSAGGNMTLGVISHILHPHPDPSVPRIEQAFGKGRKLKGAFLIAPWTDPFSSEYDSMKRNYGKDLLSATFLLRWSSSFLNGQPQDPYNKPIATPAGWWDNVSEVLEGFFLACGLDDLLLDSALQFATTFKQAWKDEKDTTVALAENEGHISCIMDPSFGFKSDDVQMYVQARDWLRKTLPPV